MKRLSLTLFVIGALACALSARAYESPGKPTGFVNDFAGLFSLDQKVALEMKLSAFEKETGAEISVVTLKSLGGDDAAGFAVKLMEEWGIGKKGVDNGILFMIAMEERDVRIDVGYGLEPTVTDGAASAILRNIVLPAFKDGEYFAGVTAGTDRLMAIIKGDPEAVNFATDSSSEALAINWEVIVFVIFLIIMLSTRRGRKMLPYVLMFMGRGGGSSGGGFGGFGGGRSGGGGAGGKW